MQLRIENCQLWCRLRRRFKIIAKRYHNSQFSILNSQLNKKTRPRYSRDGALGALFDYARKRAAAVWKLASCASSQSTLTRRGCRKLSPSTAIMLFPLISCPSPRETAKGWREERDTNSCTSEKDRIIMRKCFIKIPPKLYKRHFIVYNSADGTKAVGAHYIKMTAVFQLTVPTRYTKLIPSIWWT